QGDGRLTAWWTKDPRSRSLLRANGAAGTRATYRQTERSNGAFGKSDIEGKVARVAARKRGRDRVSSEREHRVKTFEVRSSDFKHDPLFLSCIASGLRYMRRTTIAARVSPARGANEMSDIEGTDAREAP